MSPPLVLVTGVSGFIASWVAYAALKVGYQVRGTVRSLQNEDKIKHLRDLCPGSPYKLELVEADLTSEVGWEQAVTGCDYILHVASPFVLAEPKNPDDLILPAVEGTLRVLRAASKLEKKPKRIVVTSSTASIAVGQAKTEYTDTDWTVLTDPAHPVGSYPKSKTLAEKAAWDFMASLPEEQRIELATINPVLVVGPLLSVSPCASAELIGKVLLREIPALADISMGIVSVYDVARAHLLAMTAPAAANQRFLLSEKSIKFADISKSLCREMTQYGYSPVSFLVPNFIIHTLAFFGDRDAKTAARNLGKEHVYLSKNAQNILGLLKNDAAECNKEKEVDWIVEMAKSAAAKGLFVDKSKDGSLSKTYTPPDFDTSMIPAPASG